MINYNRGFSFFALAYNHEAYVVEHLESIKFIVKSYGEGVECNLVVNDDCSSDNTVYLIDQWLERNQSIFSNVVKLYNEKNIGTCASVLNMLNYAGSDLIKITACDDVYSYENILEYVDLPSNTSIRSGLPLSLIDDVLFEDKLDVLNILASDFIYRNKKPITRFKLLSNNNSPNIIYNTRCITDKRIRDFLSGFDVVEDWPVQIAIAENYSDSNFELIRKVFVYYRRTSGSAYMVAKNRFYNDKISVYNYLINKEGFVLTRILLKNRLFCFKLSNRYLNKILNSCFYVYIFSFIFFGFFIFKDYRDLRLNVDNHRKHFLKIKLRSDSFLKNLK